MSRRRRFKGRDVHGILLLDKPTGLTSNDVLQKVKRIYNAAKAGHTGALDPLATGMLPICLGEATKFSQYLLEADKRYEVTAKLGERTNTSDSDGEVVSTRPVDVAVGTLIEALDQFRGPIMQVPSMYSALKHNGRQLLGFEGNEVKLEVHCSKGTYIRSLVDDLGEVLGCGAHVTQLRRTQVASYPYDRMLTLEQLECIFEQAKAESIPPREQLDPLLLPMDTAVASLPEVNMQVAVAAYVNQGQAVQVAGSPQSGQVRMTVGPEREFIGVGEIDDEGRVAPKRLVRYHDEE